MQQLNRNARNNGRRGVNKNASGGKPKQPTISISKIKGLGDVVADPALAAILSKADAKIRLELEPDNAVVRLLSLEGGKRLGTIAELQKIAGFRKFATDQRKISESESVLAPIRTRIFNAVQEVRAGGTGEFLPSEMQPGVIGALKEAGIITSRLDKNQEALVNAFRNATGGAKVIIVITSGWVAAIKAAYHKLYVTAVQGGEIKGLLNDEIFKSNVPKWAFDKLTKVDLSSVLNTDPRRFLFPADVKKGISLTVKEWTTPGFVANEWLLRYSDWTVKVLTDAALVKAATKSENLISFSNESDTLGVSLRSEKFIVSPIMFDTEYNFGPKAKKVNPFLINPSFQTAKLGLRTIIEFGLAIQTMDFKSSDPISAFWAPIGSIAGDSAMFNNVSNKRNVFRVLVDNDQATNAVVENVMTGDSDEVRKLIAELFPALLGLRVSDVLVERALVGLNVKIDEVLDDFPDTAAFYHAVVEPVHTQLHSSALMTSLDNKVETSANKELLAKVGILTGLDKPAKKNKARNNALSSMTGASRALLKKIDASNDASYLADPIRDWLASFGSEDLQTVAAELVKAQFGVILDIFEDDEEGESSDEDSDAGSEE